MTAWWGGPLLSVGGSGAGHTVGRTVSARRDAECHDVKPIATLLEDDETSPPDIGHPVADPRPDVSPLVRLPQTDGASPAR